MAKPNYRQQKRQKELSRKSRQAERLQRRTSKLEGDDQPVDASPGTAQLPGDTMPPTPTLTPDLMPKNTP